MHTPQPTIYGYDRNVYLWNFPWPKCPGLNVLGRNVRGRNVLHSLMPGLQGLGSGGIFCDQILFHRKSVLPGTRIKHVI